MTEDAGRAEIIRVADEWLEEHRECETEEECDLWYMVKRLRDALAHT